MPLTSQKQFKRLLRRFKKLYKRAVAKSANPAEVIIIDNVPYSQEIVKEQIKQIENLTKPRKEERSRSLTFVKTKVRCKSAPTTSYAYRHDYHADHEQAPLFGSLLNREWEIVSVDEVKRRLSLDDLATPSNLPLPQGATQSKILDEHKLRQFVEILPARAEGYPWRIVYASHEHGFSLRTLYRRMAEWHDEMSPVIIVVRDTNGRVFGCCVSAPIRLEEHSFAGTGDSCYLFSYVPLGYTTADDEPNDELRVYNWTGANQWFVNASPQWLAIGAGSGHHGLWLDQDLNHGRTQPCATFDNEPLTVSEDFIIDAVECFAFALDAY